MKISEIINMVFAVSDCGENALFTDINPLATDWVVTQQDDEPIACSIEVVEHICSDYDFYLIHYGEHAARLDDFINKGEVTQLYYNEAIHRWHVGVDARCVPEY